MTSLRAVRALAVKDIRLLVRDRGALFFTLGFPLLMGLAFGWIFGGGGSKGRSDLEVAVFDRDASASSRAFIDDLGGEGSGVSTSPAADLDACVAAVRTREAIACVVLEEGFGRASDAFFAGGPMRLGLHIDPSRGAEGGLLTGKLNALAYQRMQSLFAGESDALRRARAIIDQGDAPPALKSALGDLYTSIERLNDSDDDDDDEAPAPGGAAERDAGDDGGFQPVVITTSEVRAERSGPPNAFAVSFPQGIIWGLMSCVMSFSASLVRERTQGTMVRLMIAPLAPAAILAAKSLACFLTCILLQALMIAFAALVFDLTVSAPFEMAVAMVCSAIAFVGVTVLIAGLSRSEEGADGLGRSVLLLLALFGGGTIPIFVMPPAMAAAASISPFKWASVAIEGALWRGFTLAELALPLAVLLAFGVGGFVIGVLAMRRRGAG